MMSRAIEAPTPTLPVPDTSALAVAALAVSSSAASLTAPALLTVTTAEESSVAALSVSRRLSASEPAMPTLLAPAPEVAVMP
jgi:hypothetical protein